MGIRELAQLAVAFLYHLRASLRVRDCFSTGSDRLLDRAQLSKHKWAATNDCDVFARLVQKRANVNALPLQGHSGWRELGPNGHVSCRGQSHLQVAVRVLFVL